MKSRQTGHKTGRRAKPGNVFAVIVITTQGASVCIYVLAFQGTGVKVGSSRINLSFDEHERVEGRNGKTGT